MYLQSIFEIQVELCKTMSNAVRSEIVYILREGPRRVMDISQIIGIPKRTISRHLRILRKGNVVTASREAYQAVFRPSLN